MSWFKKLKRLFSEEVVKPRNNPPRDPHNPNYVCLVVDPINTVNDLREGDWNMDKVQRDMAMGLLRHAKQSEVEAAREIGRIK